MFTLALRSLRHRTTAFTASFLAVFLGATVVMGFAAMLDTSTGPDVSQTSQETLVTMAAVVGSYGLVIVIVAVASALTLAVRQRHAELALLRNVGATPGQVGRLIIGETAVLTLAAAVLAIGPAVLVGRALLALLVATDQVAAPVEYRFGVFALSIGIGVTVVAGLAAAAITALRVGRMRPAEALRTEGSLRRVRVVIGLLLIASGTSMAVVTMTAMNGKGFEAMATAAEGAIQSSIGLALLAPALLRGAARLLPGSTAVTLRRRSLQMGAAVMPIILFTGIATGTLYAQYIENATLAAEGLAKTNDHRNLETLNYVIVGMIVVFAAIMLVNTMVAATMHRRREFGQLRLVGATPHQVLRMVTAEALVLSGTGVLFGSLASLLTIVPYTVARTDSVLPDAPIWIYLGVVAAALALTLSTSLSTTRRALRTPAPEAAHTP